MMYYMLVIVLILINNINCISLHPGEIVPTTKRSQYHGYRTASSPLLVHEAPRFMENQIIPLNKLSLNRDYAASNEFKVSFSFDNDRFITSWITVSDGSGNMLDYIQFDFIYSGDQILQVKWTTDYYDLNTLDDKGKAINNEREHIYLRYHWHEYVEVDTGLGVNLLLLVGVSIGWLSAAVVIWGLIDSTQPNKNNNNINAVLPLDTFKGHTL